MNNVIQGILQNAFIYIKKEREKKEEEKPSYPLVEQDSLPPSV
jgi:hypothetical protein